MTLATKQNWLQREFNRETIEIVAKYAPPLTPLMPATAIVIGMAVGLSEGYEGWAFFLALLPAIGTGLGMEGTGFMASYLLIWSIQKMNVISAIFSLAFLGGYAYFAYEAMGKMKNAEMFQYMVLMSVITYLCVGLYTYNNKRVSEMEENRRILAQELAEKRKSEMQSKLDDLEYEKQKSMLKIEQEKAAAEIEAMKAAAYLKRMELEAETEHQRTLQANAEARRAKAENGGNFRKVSESFGDWRKLPQAEKERVKGMTIPQEVMDAFGVSERTALNWLKYAKGE